MIHPDQGPLAHRELHAIVNGENPPLELSTRNAVDRRHVAERLEVRKRINVIIEDIEAGPIYTESGPIYPRAGGFFHGLGDDQGYNILNPYKDIRPPSLQSEHLFFREREMDGNNPALARVIAEELHTMPDAERAQMVKKPFTHLVKLYEEMTVTLLAQLNIPDDNERMKLHRQTITDLFSEHSPREMTVPTISPRDTAEGWIMHFIVSNLREKASLIGPEGTWRTLKLLSLFDNPDQGMYHPLSQWSHGFRGSYTSPDFPYDHSYGSHLPPSIGTVELDQWIENPYIRKILFDDQTSQGDIRNLTPDKWEGIYERVLSNPDEAIHFSLFLLREPRFTQAGIYLLQQLSEVDDPNIMKDIVGFNASFREYYKK